MYQTMSMLLKCRGWRPLPRGRALEKQGGFSLIEVAISIALLAFCLMTLAALLPVGVNTARAASEEMLASNIAASVLADLRAAPLGQASAQYGLMPDQTSPWSSEPLFVTEHGELVPQTDARARYRMMVSIFPPTEDGQAAAIVGVRVSWPTEAAPGTALGAVEFVTGLYR